jgi:hypothetical protein
MLIIRQSAFAIDDAGLRLGSVKLAKARQGVLQPYPAALNRLPAAAQGTVVKAVAAWNRGDKATALIYLLHLGQPELAPSKGWLRHQYLVRMAKAGFDPNEPRDAQGRWTSENAAAGDSRHESADDDADGASYQPAGYMPAQELFLPGTSSEELPNGEFPEDGLSPEEIPDDDLPNMVKPPLDKFPDDPTKPPTPDHEWHGGRESQPGDDRGAWVKRKDGSSLHPDFDHQPPIKPHYDYVPKFRTPNYPNKDGYRWFPDGTMEPRSFVFNEEA